MAALGCTDSADPSHLGQAPAPLIPPNGRHWFLMQMLEAVFYWINQSKTRLPQDDLIRPPKSRSVLTLLGFSLCTTQCSRYSHILFLYAAAFLCKLLDMHVCTQVASYSHDTYLKVRDENQHYNPWLGSEPESSNEDSKLKVNFGAVVILNNASALDLYQAVWTSDFAACLKQLLASTSSSLLLGPRSSLVNHRQ